MRFVPAALDGAGGKLQGTGCGVWSSNLVLHAQTAPGPKPIAQAACNDFNKGCIDTGRVYQPGFADYITLHYPLHGDTP